MQNVFLIGVGNEAINRLASQALASTGIGEGIRQPVDGVQAMVMAAGGGGATSAHIDCPRGAG